MPRPANSSPQTLQVLRVLVSEAEHWHYGYDLSTRTGLKSGTLYPILARLAERNWLTTRWVDSDQPGRPRRHTYRVTPEGVRAALALLHDAQVDPSPVLRPGKAPGFA